MVIGIDGASADISQLVNAIQKKVWRRIVRILRAELETSQITLNKIREIIQHEVETSKTYQAMLHHGTATTPTLKDELGLTTSEIYLKQILHDWLSPLSLSVIQERYEGNHTTGRIGYIEIILHNLRPATDLLSLEAAQQKYSKGTLPWLDWILNKGNTTIVTGYDSVTRSGQFGRSHGYTLMFERAGGWRVPSEFAGTEHDNFLTQAISKATPRIATIIKSDIVTILSGA